LVGFVTYLWVFGSSLRALWKKTDDKEYMMYGIGLIPLLIAYAIHNSFIFDTSANFLVFFTVLGFVSFLSLQKTSHPENKHAVHKKPEPIRQPKVNNTLLGLTAVLLFVAVIFVIYKINVLPSKANYTTTRAIIAGWSQDFPGAIEKYKEAVKYDVPGKYEIRHRFAQYVLEGSSSGKLPPEKIDAINLAIDEVKKNLEENKPDYLPYLYLSRLYITLGKEDPASEYNNTALDYSLKALALAPEFVRTYYEVGQVYLNKKDLDKAVEYFRKAAELNPEVGLSHWYWGVVEIERGNINFGLEIVEKAITSGAYVPAENDLNRLISIYLSRNELAKVVWGYELLVKIKPDNPQVRASLAVAYARVGKIDEAVAEAKEAARLSPEFEPEAKLFIQQLGREW